MAITILPREESAGEGLGTAFGRGLSGVLQRQAEIASQLKMRELLKGLERKEALPALEKAFPGKGEMLLNMPAEMRVPLMKHWLDKPDRERFNTTMSGALSRARAQQGYMQQPMGQGAQAPMQQQPGQAEQQGAIQAGQGQESTSGIPGLIDISQVDFSGLDEMKALEAMNAIEKHNNAIIKEHGQESRFQREMDEKRQNRLNKMTEAQAARADRYHQESQPYFEELLNKSVAGKDEIPRLRRMEMQAASGELPAADWVNMASGIAESVFGKFINFNTLIGPEGEEFNKEVNELASTWAGHLSGKVTDTRLKMIKDSIVSLLHTPEGKMRIIKNMIALRNMDIAKYNIASRISEKNAYLRPLGFREMVEKEWDEERGKYEKDYINMFSDKPGSEQIAEKYINKIGDDTEDVVDTPEVQAATQPEQAAMAQPVQPPEQAAMAQPVQPLQQPPSEQGQRPYEAGWFTKALAGPDENELSPIARSAFARQGSNINSTADLAREFNKEINSPDFRRYKDSDLRNLLPGESLPSDTWGKQGARTVVQTANIFASLIRSGTMAGDVIQETLKAAGASQATKDLWSTIIPQFRGGQAANVINQYLPDYLVKTRGGDALAQGALSFVLSAATSGGLSSVPAAINFLKMISPGVLLQSLVSKVDGRLPSGAQLLLDFAAMYGGAKLGEKWVSGPLAEQALMDLRAEAYKTAKQEFQGEVVAARRKVETTYGARESGAQKKINNAQQTVDTINNSTNKQLDHLDKQKQTAVEGVTKRAAYINKLEDQAKLGYQTVGTQTENMQVPISDKTIDLVTKLMGKLRPEGGLIPEQERQDIYAVATQLNEFISSGKVAVPEVMDYIHRLNQLVYKGVPRSSMTGTVTYSPLSSSRKSMLKNIVNELDGILQESMPKDVYNTWRGAQETYAKIPGLLNSAEEYNANVANYTRRLEQKSASIQRKSASDIKQQEQIVTKASKELETYRAKKEAALQDIESGATVLKSRKLGSDIEGYLQGQAAEKVPYPTGMVDKQGNPLSSGDLGVLGTIATGSLKKGIGLATASKIVGKLSQANRVGYMKFLKANHPELAAQIQESLAATRPFTAATARVIRG
jgi:hypothetical protein